MKKTGSFTAKLLSCAIALLAVGLVSETQAKEGKAVVRAVRGSAQVSESKSGVWKPLKVGQTLKSGATIKTAADSNVDLFLEKNGPVLRVTPETQIGLDQLTYDDTGADMVIDTGLNLKTGRILGNVKKLAAASKYEVKTPNGVAGVRGTDFDIKVTPITNPDGTTSFQLTITSLNGTLVASSTTPSGQVVTAVVNAGETWTPASSPDVTPLPPEVVRAANIALAEAMTAATGNNYAPDASGNIVDNGPKQEDPGTPPAPPTPPGETPGETTSNPPLPPNTGDPDQQPAS